MKIKRVLLAGALSLSISGTVVLAVTSPSHELRDTFAAVRTAELPREVARLVEKASKDKSADRADRCVTIVREAVMYNPASAPLIVGSASRVAPELAARFATAAMMITTKNAPGIARSAAASAPRYAGEIAAAVAQVRPSEYAQIAYEVTYAVPGVEKEVVESMLATLPNLRPVVMPVVAANSGAIAGSEVGSAQSKLSVADLVTTAPQVQSVAQDLGMTTQQYLSSTLTRSQSEKVNTHVTAYVAATIPAGAKETTTSPGNSGNTPAAQNAASGKGTVTVSSANTSSPNPTALEHASDQALANGKGLQYDKPGNGPKDKNGDGKPGNGPK